MNKSQLALRIAARSGITKRTATEMVDVVFDSLIDVLREGCRISIRGLGAFEVREHKEKTGRNPQTGEPLVLPPRRSIVLRASRSLRSSLNNTGGACADTGSVNDPGNGTNKRLASVDNVEDESHKTTA